jgi:transcriptional regulator with XRE-family HTH domain
MSFLQNKWSEHERQANPVRRYANQREFEADWVYSMRRRYKVSQESLAVMANVSVTTVQNWENPRSAKAIAEHNQGRLRDIERDLWIKAHVTLLDPCPPYIKALYDLMSASKDDSAQALADYLVATMPGEDAGRARLLHWASLTHSISQPGSPRARSLSEAALDALAGSDTRLSAAIENEILGSQFEDLLALPPGEARQRQGTSLMRACERLFQRDQQPAYLWNALEVACRAPLDSQDVFRLVQDLVSLQGHAHVRHRIMTEANFDAARLVFDDTATRN